ncbi:hypothetical protein SBV1_3290006 [Verrucomicrobia bacterium]|nr:hypothetical protein SBV1_3290006 [Verrucomicrobiota bacterium]
MNLDGSGQTVALVELDGFFQNDIAAYETKAGLPSLVPTVVTVGSFNGMPSTNSDSVSEVSLDIEMAISMAPGLNQMLVYERLYPAAILNQIATNNLARQISCSWFIGRSANYDTAFMTFAAQGQSFFQCSGLRQWHRRWTEVRWAVR